MTMTTSQATDFDLQPTLTGSRVIIRPIYASDWEGMFAAASDPKTWEQHPAADRYMEDVFRDYFEAAIDSGSAFTFINRETGQIIGSSRYFGLNPARSEIEIGWTFLSRPYWGGSYNLEIKQLMLEYAFRYVDTVVFWVGEDNARSRRAMEKIGGVLRDGVFTRDFSGDDPYVVYEITATNWSAEFEVSRQ
jgi:RimJ/RimL family protein N-acetyltransferase